MDKLKKIVADMLMIIVIIAMSGLSIAALYIGATNVRSGGSHFSILVISMASLAFTSGLFASIGAFTLYEGSSLRRRRKERRRLVQVNRSYERNPFRANSEW